MPREILSLALIGRLTPPATRWGEAVLRPWAVLEEAPALEAGALMEEREGARLVYLGVHPVTLHSGETKHYRDNLASRRPSVWAALSGARVDLLTVDPYEGESLAGDPGRVVEALALPPGAAAALEDFIERRHVEEEFVKRKRDGQAPPDAAGGPAPRILTQDQKWGRGR